MSRAASALVTGAARGIGAATATLLAERGYRVACLDLDEGGLATTAALIRDAGGEAFVYGCDVRDAARVAACLDDVSSRCDGLDAVVNNAARWRPGGTLLELAAEDWSADLELLLSSYRTVAAAAAPHMRAGSALVNVSSVHGLLGSPGWGSYDVAKAAVIQMTRVLAAELGPAGIRVNAIAPGIIASDEDLERYRADPVTLGQHEGVAALRRVGRPGDVAGAIAFLVGPDSAFVTGHTLVVDGGMTSTLQLTAVQERERTLARGEAG